jgi:hypothetical protein
MNKAIGLLSIDWHVGVKKILQNRALIIKLFIESNLYFLIYFFSLCKENLLLYLEDPLIGIRNLRGGFS